MRKLGSVPGAAWAKVIENMSKPGVGSHTWSGVTSEEFDGERELSVDKQAERDPGGLSST